MPRIGYVLLVPVLVGVLAFTADPVRPDAAPRSGHGWATALGLLAAVLLFLGALGGVFTLQIAALPVAVTGLVAGWGGRALLRAQARALGLLAFLVPVPLPLLDGSNPALVRASGTVAVRLLSLLDPGATWLGNELGYRGWTLVVADACSGSGTSLVLLVLAVFLGGLFRLGALPTGLLCAGVLPVSLLVNGVRIAATAVVLDRFGPEAANGTPHEVLGQVLVALTAGALVLLVLRLTRHREAARPEAP